MPSRSGSPPGTRRRGDARGAGRVPLLGPGQFAVLTNCVDAGATWQELHTGLPEAAHYGPVLRDALWADDADPVGIYFGNRNGEVFASADEEDSWQQLAGHLPDVLCPRAAVIG